MQTVCHACYGAGFTVLTDGVKPVCPTCEGTGKVGVTSLQSLGLAWEKTVGPPPILDMVGADRIIINGLIKWGLLNGEHVGLRNVTPPNRIVGQIEGHKVMADADLSDIEVQVVVDALKKLEDKDG